MTAEKDKIDDKAESAGPQHDLSKNILNFANLAVAVIIILIIIFLFRIRVVLGIFLASTVLSVLLTPPVQFLQKRRFPKVTAILTIYIIFLGILVLTITLLVPIVYEQAKSIINDFPKYWESLLAMYSSFEEKINIWGKSVGFEELFNLSSTERQIAIANAAKRALNQGWGYIIATASVITTLISIPVITFYMLKDGPVIRQTLMGLIPESWRGSTNDLLGQLSGSIYGYLKGQVMLCIVIFLMTWPILAILGVPYAALLAVLAGLTEFIPIIGPTIALIPAVLIAIFAEPASMGLIVDLGPEWRGLIVMLSYFGIQLTESNLVVPRVMGRAMDIHPLGVIFALLCGAVLAGVWGMLLSLPVAAAVKVFYHYYYPSFIKRIDNLLRFE